jgi:hypothetical protein
MWKAGGGGRCAWPSSEEEDEEGQGEKKGEARERRDRTEPPGKGTPVRASSSTPTTTAARARTTGRIREELRREGVVGDGSDEDADDAAAGGGSGAVGADIFGLASRKGGAQQQVSGGTTHIGDGEKAGWGDLESGGSGELVEMVDRGSLDAPPRARTAARRIVALTQLPSQNVGCVQSRTRNRQCRRQKQ